MNSELEKIADRVRYISDSAETMSALSKEECKDSRAKIQMRKQSDESILLKKYADIGFLLLEAKGIVKKDGGSFKKWMKKNCSMSPTSCGRCMALANYVSETNNYPNMSIMSFVEMQAATDEQKLEINKLIDSGGFVTVSKIRFIRGKANVSSRTTSPIVEKRLLRLLNEIEISNFSDSDLLNIRDEFQNAVEYISERLFK